MILINVIKDFIPYYIGNILISDEGQHFKCCGIHMVSV